MTGDRPGKLLYTFAAAGGKWTSPNNPNFRSATTPTPNIHKNNPFRTHGSDRFDQEALKLARQYRGTGLDDAQARKTIGAAVAVAVDIRREFQKSEAARMHTKLKKIQQAIEIRDKLRQRIIERRVDELLDPNVNWDATSTNRNLSAPVGWIVDGPGPGVLEMPVTATSIGLPGPPHIPNGRSASLNSSDALPATMVAATWRQATELYIDLSESRQFVQMSVAEIGDQQRTLKASQRSLTELKKLTEWKNLTDEDRQRGIDAAARNIRSHQEQVTLFLSQWKHHWSVYESQLKLLQLDIDEARIRHSAARTALERVRELVENGVMTTTEHRKAETELAVSEIAVKRAELHLAPYAAIQIEMSELNPRNFDARQLLKDPLESSAPAVHR